MPAANTSRPSVCWKGIVGTARTTSRSWRMCHASWKVRTKKQDQWSAHWSPTAPGLIVFFPPVCLCVSCAHRAHRVPAASSGRSALSQRFPGQSGVQGVPVHPVHPTRLLPNALPRTVSTTVTRRSHKHALCPAQSEFEQVREVPSASLLVSKSYLTQRSESCCTNTRWD